MCKHDIELIQMLVETAIKTNKQKDVNMKLKQQ